MKFAKEIEAYAKGMKIECHCAGWTDWMPLEEMRDSALRAFLEIESDPEWSFRVKETDYQA